LRPGQTGAVPVRERVIRSRERAAPVRERVIRSQE
jgi:hypothetical protein